MMSRAATGAFLLVALVAGSAVGLQGGQVYEWANDPPASPSSGSQCVSLSVQVKPGQNSLKVGETRGFSATVWCDNQNITAQSTVSWTVTGGIGSVSPAAGPTTVFTAVTAGSGAVVAAANHSGQQASGQASVVVGGGGPACAQLAVSVSPSSASLVVGGTKQFTATVLCDQQDVTQSSQIVWTTRGGVGTISPASGPATIFDATTDGTGTLTANATYQSMSSQGSAAVTVGGGGGGCSAWVFPTPVVLRVGDVRWFGANVYCNNQNVTSQSSISWSVGGGIGTVSPTSGHIVDFTATLAGSGTLLATANYQGVTVSGVADITVQAAEPGTFVLSGQVTDESGAAVAGALVVAHFASNVTEAKRSSTVADGTYSLVLLTGVGYEVRVSAPGFDEQRTDLKPSSGDVSVNFRMRAPGGIGPVWIAGGFAVGLVGSLAAAWAIGSLLGLDALLWALLFIPVVLYSRIKKGAVLDQFKRGEIYGNIRASPGIRYRQLMRLSMVGNGTLSYHLYVLERGEKIRSVTQGFVRRYYPSEMKPPERMLELTELQRKILFTIVNEPGLPEAEIARSLQVSSQRAGHNIRLLQRKGLVKIEQSGRAAKCYVSDDPRVRTITDRAAGPPTTIPAPVTE